MVEKPCSWLVPKILGRGRILIKINMGFHKRYISNEQVIEIYKTSGIEGVKDWYTKGVDALVLETGLSSEIDDILSGNYEPSVDLTETTKWSTISDMILTKIKE